jgi:hypothetical protein
MARAYGSRAQMALAFESSYGTAPASGFSKMPFARSAPGAAQPLLDNELLGYGRNPLAPTLDVIDVAGDVVVPIDDAAFALWLKLAFGAPSTTGSTTYTHVYTSGANSLPSAAIEIGNPEASDYRMLTGCGVNTLGMRFQRGGLLQATVGLIGQNEEAESTAQSGTLAEFDPLNRFGQMHASIKGDGSSLGAVTAAECTFTNNLDPVPSIRSDGLIEAADPTICAFTGTLTIRYADTTLRDAAVAGTAYELEFALTKGDHSLTFTAHECYLSRPSIPIEGPGGVEVQYAFQAALNDSEGTMLTVELVNDVASYA